MNVFNVAYSSRELKDLVQREMMLRQSIFTSKNFFA